MYLIWRNKGQSLVIKNSLEVRVAKIDVDVKTGLKTAVLVTGPIGQIADVDVDGDIPSGIQVLRLDKGEAKILLEGLRFAILHISPTRVRFGFDSSEWHNVFMREDWESRQTQKV